LDQLNYSGERIDVILFGPAASQSIWPLSDANTEIADWVIQHKDVIVSAGIPDEEVILDYVLLNDDAGRFLAVSVCRNATIEKIRCTFESDFKLHMGNVRPLLGLLLKGNSLGAIMTGAVEPSFPLPGIESRLKSSGDGYHLMSQRVGRPKTLRIEGIEPDSLPSDLNHREALIFGKGEDSFQTRLHRFALGRFKLLFNGLLIVALTAAVANVTLAVFESKRAEELQEYKFLEASLKKLQGEANDLQEKSGNLNKLKGLKSHLASGLSAVASFKPDKVWWRKIDYKVEGTLSIEGYSVGEDDLALYSGKLKESDLFGSVEMGQIAKYIPPPDSPIPAKFHPDVMKYKLLISGVY
jgi:hypothetical protein